MGNNDAGGVTSVAGKSGAVTLVASDLTDFNTAADSRITAQKAQNNGLATLDGTGKVPSNQLALSSNDIPALDASKITSGTITQNVSASSVSGSNGAFTNLKVYDGVGQYLTMKLPTGGTGYTLNWPNNIGSAGQFLQTDASGNLSWVAGPAAPVTSVAGKTGAVTLSSADIGGLGTAATLNVAASGNAASNEIVKGNDTRLTGAFNSSTALSGDLSGTLPSPVVEKIKGQSVSAVGSSEGQVLRYAGANTWTPAFISMFDLRSTVTGTQSFGGVGCLANQTLTWTAATDNLACANIAISNTQVSGLVASATTDTTNATNITSGTLNINRLPTAVTNSLWTESSGNVSRSTGKVGIGTSSPAASSLVEMASTNSGLLIPRMTTTQKNAIASPAIGLQVYDTTTNQINYYNGSTWQALGVAGSGISSLTAGTGLTGGTITTSGTVAVDVGTGVGQIVQVQTGGKLPALDASNLTGLTSAQVPNLDVAKITTGTLSVARGGTGSSTALTNNKIMVSSGGGIIESAALTNGQILIGSTGAAPVVANLIGTANQLTVTNGAGSITLSTPQNIHTGATPTFAGLNLTPSASGGLTLNPFGVAAGNTSEIRFNELAAGGTNYVGFKSPDALSANKIWTLPAADGTANQVLKTDGAGNLGWASASSGTVTSVSSANTDISVATGTTTPVMTLNSATAGGAGDANKIPKLDASGLLAVNMIPNLSAAKITSGVLPIANGGTNSSTALNNNRVMVSSGSKIVETAAITASRALASDVNGLPVASATTATELGYLNGVTSSVQTQLNAKSSATGWANYSVIGTNGSGNMTAITGSAAGSILQYAVTGPAYSTATYPSTTTANQLLYSSANNVIAGLSTANNSVLTTNASGVPSWSPSSNDLFSQYARLAGRAGGQSLVGGTAASENLVLESTSNATKGAILLNPNGGNVAIGETPASNNVLTVRRDQDEATRIVVKNSTDGTLAKAMVQMNSAGVVLNIEANAPTFGGAPLTGGAGGAGIWTPSTTTGGLAIGTTAGSLRFLTSSTERVRVDTSGNVGIGTQNPSSKVHIDTTTQDYLTLTTAGNYGGDTADVKYTIKPINGSYGGDAVDRGGLQFKNESTYGGDPLTGVFSFDGNVGIGTTSPSTALQVAGSVNVGSQTTRTTATTGRGQLALSSSFKKTSAGSTTLDANNGNIQEVESFLCNGTNTITFSNMKDGGAYTVLISGAAAHTGLCLFALTGLTFKTSGGNSAPLSGKDVLFTFVVIGTTVIYNMVDNLQ